MKKGTLNLIPVVLNRSLLALFMLLGCSTVALATYSTNVTTSTPTYTAGQVNTFNFTVTVTTDGTIEYVDQIRFTFPGTLTVGAATGPEPYLFCGGGQGNKTIAGNVVRWDTPGGPGSFCGAFATGGYNFSVDIDIPAGFSGPLNLTMTTSGDGWPSGSITVIDLPVTINQLLPPEPCVFNCPTNMTFNLAPGECRISVPYTTPYFTGDCLVPIEGPFSLTQNLNTMIVQDALDCTAGTPTSQWRAYNALQGDFTINTVRLGTFFAGTVQVFIYSYTGVVGATTLDLAQMTLLGQSNAACAPGGQQIYAINLPTPVTVPAGTAFVVEARRTAAGGFAVAGNYGGETGPSYISCPTLGIVAPQTYASVGFGNIHVIQILEGTQLQLLPGVVTQTSGLPSGAEFERGTTENCYELGNPVTGEVLESCCFSITVNEYANPISSLVCNDLVQISLDANCSAVLNADQILEGGPYGCYDDYIVELDKTAPFGNGPWLPAVLGPQDVGKTYQVRVTDPDTGNKCWGNLKVEDKLPPVLVCQNVDVPCNVTGLPGENVAMTADAAFPTFNSATGTTTSTTDVNITTMSQITGLTVTFNTTHTWVGDIDARLTAPNGTTIVLFDRPGFPAAGVFGCDGDGMAVVFNDNAALTAADLENTCNAAVPTISGTYQAVGSLASLVAGGVNGTWTLAVQDFVAGDDGTFNVTLNIQGIGPIAFPNSLQQNVNVFANGQACYTVTAGTGTPVLEPCSAASLCYLDTEVSQNCASGLTKIINRKWTATDASGNTATCIQQIRFLRPTLDDLVLPPNYDDVDEPSLPCSGLSPNQITPGYLEGIGLQGYPYVFGAPDGCNIGWTYEDAVIGVCDGTYKIRRKWTIIDWCSGTDFEHNQIIKVADHAGPTFDCPANITVSTDPFTCCATVDLPDFIASDNCSRIKKITAMVTVIDPQTGQVLNMYNVGGSMSSFPGNNLWEPDTMVNVGSTPCLPIGSHQVMYTLEDDCGNTTVCEFRVIVRDYTPPVAACDEFTVVGIGVDDPFDCYGPAGFLDVPPALDACSFAGVTWVKATTFDDGSYDNCGDVKFTIRRMAPYSDCITGLNPIRGFPDCASPFPTFPSEFERAITEGDSIKFYCCEVGTEQTVVLTVYQLDVNGNIVIGPTGEPVRNECMITVSVQDKIKPVCQSPANVTVSCENFDPSLWAYGKAAVYDNCCLDTAQVYQGQCGLSHTANYNFFDTLCSKGTITRTFRAFDCHGQSSQCTQRVFVNYEQDYWLKFPNDVIITVCDGTGNYGEPEFNGEDCELLGVSFEDEIFTVVPDACYKIERTWTVINWCTYSPNQPCVAVPNPNPNATSNNPANLVGPTIAPLGTPQPWTPTNVRVNPTDPQTTNYSVFYHGGTYTNYATGQQITVPSIANNNCFKYKQIIKIIDGQKPVVQCPASPVEICDLTPNDSQFWNESYWYDAQTMSHDLCEAPTDLCVTATDLCSGSNISIRYILFLDLNGDGVMETVVSSSNPPGYNNVQFGNAQNPNFTGGTPSAFDERPVPANQKYGFTIQNTVSGNDKTACVRWNTIQQPNNYVVPQLPYGTHKIKWVVTDGCGNEEVCEYTFVVKDCKKPTVVCINGLSVNIMPTKMISLWDTDFLQYTEDNCTPSNKLVTAIRKSGTGTGFPTNPDGTPQKSVTFDCNELGTQFVELWSMDLAGNADYCETYVIVQDNMGICGTNFGNVAGALKTEGTNGLEDATVTLTGSHPALPGGSLFDVTNQTGDYMLNAVPLAGDFTLTPMKDNDPLNGVSTFDLVLINKHILGLEPLNTPYKMIAADANNSRSITTFDIVELRKLILGIYTELPNNTSWRFVDKAYNFPNPANPFSTIFPETKQIANMQASMDQEDFVSVKTGDVNGNAVTSSLMSTEDRTAGTLLFDVEDRAVKAGEEFTVTFKAAEKVQGYQFTMNYNNLELVNIAPGASMQLDNFGVFAKEGALTTSWDGTNQAEFALTFRAKANGMLSQMLGVSSRITKAEAYNAGADRLSVAFRFNGANGSTIAGLGFELYQNTPNPFINKTQIGFYLPEAAEATLSIFDESGRMIFTQRGDYSKGYNAVTIDRGVLNTSGVLYYQLETADNSATRKMIQSK